MSNDKKQNDSVLAVEVSASMRESFSVWRKSMGFKTDSEAVRYLIIKATQNGCECQGKNQ